MLRAILSSLLAVFCMALSAAVPSVDTLPVKTINGTPYHIYTVKSGDTIYSLCRTLGISREQLVALNPSLADGTLRAAQEIYIPVAPSVTTHTVSKGETAYGISHRYGLTLEQFYALNPGATEGLKAGDVVIVSLPQNEQAPDTLAAVPAPQPESLNTYLVKPGDTFYSISRSYGISVAQLQAVNPDITMLIEGTTINLPAGCDSRLSTNHQMLSSFVNADSCADTIYIALPLEFTRGGKTDSRSADFLRGFMLAADSLRSYGRPVGLLVYDLNSPDTDIQALLDDPMLKKAKAIVGPFGPDAFRRLAEFARTNGIYIINNFLIKDESQRTNPFVMQSSLPHDLFYGNAADYFVSNFPDVTTVFLQSTTNNRKAEMVDVMQKRLLAAGRQYMVIKFRDALDAADLDNLPAATSYAFISNTDSLPAIAPAVEKFIARRPSDKVYLWGYHDWLRHSIPGYKNLENCNAYIFSRFFVEALPADETSLGALYKHWYGPKPSDTLPHWYAYGFDCAMYLIRALNVNGGDFRGYTPSYIGSEYMFDFKPMGTDKGLTNDSEVIIKLYPGNVRFKQIM